MENQDLSYGDACGLATRSSMRADNKVLVYGLGVDDPKGMYGTTKGLVEEFGEDRCFDTPLSEDSMTGFGIGMAVGASGQLRPPRFVLFFYVLINS